MSRFNTPPPTQEMLDYAAPLRRALEEAVSRSFAENFKPTSEESMAAAKRLNDLIPVRTREEMTPIQSRCNDNTPIVEIEDWQRSWCGKPMVIDNSLPDGYMCSVNASGEHLIRAQLSV